MRRAWIIGLLLIAAASLAHAQTSQQPEAAMSPEQEAFVQRAIAAERITLSRTRQYSPLVQTYIQNLRQDPVLHEVPESDQYFLGRLDFSKSINDNSYSLRSDRGFFQDSMKFISEMNNALKLRYKSAGFMEMMFLDPVSFDQQHYDFRYVRLDILGAVRTLVFDVHPKPGTGSGRFTGRIWVEDQGGNIVRFNGAYTGGNPENDTSSAVHFDSWRENLQPGLWLPVGIYVEGAQTSSNRAVSFKAQTNIWGYNLKLPAHESDNELIALNAAEDQSEAAQDLSPLQAQREWVSQAEENVLDRLAQAGLLAAPSDFDRVLEQVTNNIIIGNSIPMMEAVHCRVLLTAPLESLAVGNTIILSKGVIDVLPHEADLAAVLSFQLAHLVLGHHIDTRYAFNDRLLFPDEATFARIHMSHSDAENDRAASKALDLLNHSVYAQQLAQPGLFFSQLGARSTELTALNTPRIGDSLLRSTGEPWLNALIPNAPKADLNNLDQITALPLGSQLSIDAWDDRVIRSEVRHVPILNARDRMPFEITPMFLGLDRYEARIVRVSSSDQAGESGFRNLDETGEEVKRTFEKRVVHIFFATDRAPNRNAGAIQDFTGDRSSNDDPVFGSADISIPPGHTMGVVENPSLLALRLNYDRNKDIYIISAQSLSEEQFFNSVNMQVGNDPRRQALVYVHGFNTTFNDAERRLAQITYDLQFPGAPILYSWPSKGSFWSYAADEVNVEWSSPHFIKFLRMLEQDKKIETIYIIAHSMGNRLITSALETMSRDSPLSSTKLGEVIMAAPDVDAGSFGHLAKAMHTVAPRITVYESSKDLALFVSHRYHQYPRLGDTDPTIHVFKNYECIEATSVDTSLLGHSYIGDSPSILADIFDLITAQAPASRRFRLQEHVLNGLPYWSFRK